MRRTTQSRNVRIILGLLIVFVALFSANQEALAASASIEIRDAIIGGYGLPVYNKSFRVQIATYGFGYGFKQGVVAYFKLSLVKEGWLGGSQVFPASENAVITFGTSPGSRCLFTLNKNYYLPASSLPKGSFNVHWQVTLVVIYQGHTYTASMNSNSMKLVNQ